MPQKLLRQLAAILLGNLVYFWALPHLPESLRHKTMSLDPGLLLDFGLCVLIYLVILRVPEERDRRGSTTK